MKLPIFTALNLFVSTSLTLTAATPLNLARWDSGASLLIREAGSETLSVVKAAGNSRESVFLSSDPSQGYRLERGVTEIVIDLGMVRTVSEFGFQSFSAGTQCQVSASLSRPQAGGSWRGMGQVSVSPGSSASLSNAPIQARYIKMTFTTETPGEVSSLVLTGVEEAESARVQRPSRVENEQPGQSGLIAVDLASTSQGASVMVAAGFGDGEDLNRLADQNPLTVLTMTGNAPAVIVYDLGVDCDIDALAFSHRGFKGSVEAHIFPGKLPEGVLISKDGDPAVTVSPYFLATRKPDEVLTAAAGDFRSRKVFSSRPARFLVTRWIRAEGSSSAPEIGGFSVIGNRQPDRVVPSLLVAGQTTLIPVSTSGQVVGAVTPQARAAARRLAAQPISRPADVQVNAADFSSPE